jgi:4,5-DOPA dioxygenase extradiol
VRWPGTAWTISRATGSLPPHAERNHPTDEHLLPLYTALGAAGEKPRAERLHVSSAGVPRLDAYAFGERLE